jgi:tRNA pseudouridine38-40 synthase
MRYFFRVEYDGAGFGGWQKQKNAPGVQEAVENAFGTILRRQCTIIGAGRTDAGVHARGQGAHIEVPATLDIQKTIAGVNAVLPDAVAIYDLKPVDDRFHARYSAMRRRYEYCMTERKSPLWRHRAWCLRQRPDWERVCRNIPALLGAHDFSAFCASGTTTRTTRCTVFDSGITRREGLYVFYIEADRYIYKMVRSLVGTLVDIGRGRLDDTMESILASRKRDRVGETAPPWGLVLDRVTYPGEL